jgi:ketosteroid isomerase-like protein
MYPNRRHLDRFIWRISVFQKWSELFDEDAIQEMPFVPEGMPDKCTGKQNLYHHYKHLPEMFESMTFPISNLQTLADPAWVIAEYTGIIPIKGGGHYNNRYCTLFHIQRGKIKLVREYFNPLILSSSVGGRFNDTFENRT